MRRRSGWTISFLAVACLALCLTFFCEDGQAKSVPTWRVGDNWQYTESIFVTGDFAPIGWLLMTDWQNWVIQSVGDQTQTLPSASTASAIRVGYGNP